jgi:hypothetical protein
MATADSAKSAVAAFLLTSQPFKAAKVAKCRSRLAIDSSAVRHQPLMGYVATLGKIAKGAKMAKGGGF